MNERQRFSEWYLGIERKAGSGRRFCGRRHWVSDCGNACCAIEKVTARQARSVSEDQQLFPTLRLLAPYLSARSEAG